MPGNRLLTADTSGLFPLQTPRLCSGGTAEVFDSCLIKYLTLSLLKGKWQWGALKALHLRNWLT